MLPLLPFAAGLLTGAVALKLWRSDKTKAGIDAAGEKIRAATVSGLTRLEASTARARTSLSPPAETEALPPAKARSRSRKTVPAKTGEAPATTPKKAPRQRKSAATTRSTGETS